MTVVEPSVRARLITARTYNRPLEDGTFETWEQTVDRVVEHQAWLWKRAKHAQLNKAQMAELEELRQLMYHRKATLSGRNLWLGGTELSKKRESSQFNPLKYDTQFITTTGVRSFDEFEHGDEVEVITHLGNHAKAVVSDAGVRDMVGISLTRGRTEQHVSSSVDHSWILNTGERVQAKDLKVGDRLHKAPDDKFFTWDVNQATPDEQLWWCYGFTYGDGALATSGSSTTSRVRLCGEKAKYLPLFTSCGFEHSYPPSCNEDPFVYTGKYLKTLPSYSDAPNLIKAFLRGYLAADGNKAFRHGKHVVTGVATVDQEAAAFVHDWLPVFGVYVTSSKEVTRITNYGQFTGYELAFTTFQKTGGNLYTVKALIAEPQEQCYCLTVEGDHSFILPSGITTSNCSFTNVETVYDVVDVFWLLLQGCGVGFKPIRGSLNGFTKPIKDVEIIRSTRTGPGGDEKTTETYNRNTKVWTLKLGDSAESWAKSIGKLLAGKFAADKLILDFSNIRPAGFRLKGYGWISSGDEAISVAYTKIAEILSRRSGSLLTAIDILDVVNHLGTVLSSRRSAQIALLDADDMEAETFTYAKKDFFLHDNAHRCQSNNSLLFHTKPSRERLTGIFADMEAAGGSEPGFINADAAQRRAPWFSGCNPCLTGDTLVPVMDQGLVPINQLAGLQASIRDGEGNTTKAAFELVSQSEPIYKVKLSDGSEYKVTGTHEFVSAAGVKVQTLQLAEGELLKPSNIEGMFGSIHRPEDAYIAAWTIADGTWLKPDMSESKIYLYGDKVQYAPIFEALGYKAQGPDSFGRLTIPMRNRSVPDKSCVPDYVLQGDQETVMSFVRGYMESDGHLGETSKGWTQQICSIHEGFLLQMQQLLRLFGVFSKVSLSRAAGSRLLPDGKGSLKEYQCKDCFRLTVSNPVKYLEYFEPSLVKKRAYTKTRELTVISVTDTGTLEAVYCCGVSTTGSFDLGTIHSGNCAEILLGNKSFCNLSEVDIAKFAGDSDGLHRALHVIARANYRQTLVHLKDGILQEAWHLNNEFLRLCGVGLTGVVRRPDLVAYDYRNMERITTSAAYSMADELGTQRPKNVTTIKPSGTLSKIFDTTEGIHFPMARYIFNNVMFSENDESIPALRAANYKIVPHPFSPLSVLVTFPVSWDDVPFTSINGMELNLESAITQLERYALLQNNWTQQNTSVTISYDPAEVPAIIDWLLDHWDLYVGVSFLYRTDPTKTALDLGYAYLPQEPTTKTLYDEYVATLGVITDIRGSFVEIESQECLGGSCPVK